MIPGAPENKAISPIHVGYKLGYRHAFLSCACGAQADLNKVANKTRAAEAFRAEHEFCVKAHLQDNHSYLEDQKA